MGCCSSTKVEHQSQDKSQKKTPIADDLSVTFEDLKNIDEHAINAPKSVEGSIDALAAYLAKPAKNDIEIIRAFYVWVCWNISYDVESFFGGGRAATDTDSVLKCKRSVCEGYANIFQALCVSRKIKCEKISGFAKGYGYAIGTEISYNHRTNHAWNVVYIEGKWRFIEATWGSGHVDKNQKFVKKFSNFYFLTKPEHFIDAHFPYIDNDIEASKQWQLLKTPISLKEFCESILLKPEAHILGIELPKNKLEVISAERSCDIIIKSHINQLENISADLWESDGQYRDNSVVIIKESDQAYKVTIRPHKTGTYHLKIYGSAERDNSGMPEFVAFLVKFTAVEDNWKPFPPTHGFYGAKSDFGSRGFDSKCKLSPFHTCKDGNFNLVIKTVKNPIVTATFCDGQGSTNKDFLLLEKSDNAIVISARFLEVGYYRLTVFSELEKSESYSEAFHILILNTGTSKIRQPYPQTFSTTTEYRFRLYNPLERYIAPNTTVEFKLSSPIATGLIVNNQVYEKENNDKWNIQVKTGDSGDISVYAKTDSTSSYSGVYTFQIKS